ncbi:MBL fold metallo-hydrolase [bacterium]|nr:MBL fold metallo-hydrolase [bacterium]
MAIQHLTVTALVDNCVKKPGLRSEHGLSFLIETGHGNILFDTGQSGLFVENARQLGIELGSVEGIALSHGHYDHTGGLLHILNGSHTVPLYAHPDVFISRYTPGDNRESARQIGMPFTREAIEQSGGRFILSKESREILPGVSLTGEIPRETGFEDTGGAFFLDEGLTVPDVIPDDQSMVIETAEGLLVLLGCCHAGIINMLSMISQRWNTSDFVCIAGGMHLLNASDSRIAETIKALSDFRIGHLVPGHCTGQKAITELARSFPGATEPLHTGWTFTI